jgi:hypothetical protein
MRAASVSKRSPLSGVSAHRIPSDHIGSRPARSARHPDSDLYAETPDVDYGDVVESLKRRCAVLDIAYDSTVVTTAINLLRSFGRT